MSKGSSFKRNSMPNRARSPFPGPLVGLDVRAGVGLAAARLPGLQTVWDKGYRGEGVGVGVAVLDSGIAPLEDFGDRLVAWQDMTGQSAEPVDKYGHGTIAAGCAVGDGFYKGVAPQADLIGVRVASL
jgi:hypothetical protein